MPHKKSVNKKMSKVNCETVIVYPVVFYEVDKNGKSKVKIKQLSKSKGKNKFGMPKRDRTPDKYSEPEIHFVFAGENEQEYIQEILQNEDTNERDYIVVSGMAQGDYRKGRISKDKNGNLRVLNWTYDYDY